MAHGVPQSLATSSFRRARGFEAKRRGHTLDKPARRYKDDLGRWRSDDRLAVLDDDDVDAQDAASPTWGFGAWKPIGSEVSAQTGASKAGDHGGQPVVESDEIGLS